jgi:hypothetical protein
VSHPANNRNQRAGNRLRALGQQEHDRISDLLRPDPACEVGIGMSVRFGGVSMMLGNNALTVMPRSLSSSASASVNA